MAQQLPGDLLGVLRHLEEWQPPHNDRNVARVTGFVSAIDFSLTLPHDISSFPFSKYAATYVRDFQFGATKIPLRFAILNKQTALDGKESVEISRVIVQYLYDASLGSDRRSVLGSYIVQKAINNEAIRDEVYVQLCSQTMAIISRGFSQSTAEAAWGLLAACLGCFPPSQSLAKYLLKYVSDNGVSGYDIVCQHKLLHCLQQPQQPQKIQHQVGQSRVVRQPRAYPPCLLEWKAAAAHGCMALMTTCPDGEKLAGHVESWTTAEQFAAHLLTMRNCSDGTSGWTVTLRDEVDWYECPGHDYVLDLIAEIEVPPALPCSVAYFLPTTDSVRAAAGVGNRKLWPNQPHDANRLRLMPLEVEELPESYNALHAPQPAYSPIPRSPSPIPVHPPVIAAAPSIHPEDVYASRDELMSPSSALNKRREPSTTELSKKSALNSRYTEVTNGTQPAAAKPRPSSFVAPPPSGPELSTTSRLNERYVAGGAQPVASQPDRKMSMAPVGKPKPEPPTRKTSIRPPPTEEDWLSELFNQALDPAAANLNDPKALQRRMKGGGDNLPPPPPLQFGIGVPYGLPQQPALIQSPFMPPMADPMQLYQQQLYHQQQQQQQQQQQFKLKQQQSAELQAALEAQRLQNEVLQINVQNELLKQQLVELQRRNTVVANTPLSPVTPVVAPPPPALAHFSRKQVAIAPPPTKPKTTAKQTLDEPRVNGVAATRAVTFAASQQNGSVDAAKSTEVPAVVPPPPPAPVLANNVATNGADHADGAAAAAAAAAVGVGVVAMRRPSRKPDASAADKGSIRRPPKKIGQIRWPPVGPEDEPKKEQIEIGRIKIEEAKEENDVISPRQNTEEVQRRINEMIMAARAAEAAGEIPNKRLAPPSRPTKPPPIEIAQAGGLDMKARQERLEMQLTAVRRKKDDDEPKIAQGMVAATAAVIAAKRAAAPEDDSMPPPPPPPPPSSAPVPPPPPMAMQAAKPPEAVIHVEQPLADKHPEHMMPALAPAAFDLRSLDPKRTVLFAQSTDPFVTYDRVRWSLEIRKEVFSPSEKLEIPLLINMVFIQIVVDVANEDCIRIGKEDRVKMVNLLDHNGINVRNVKAGHNSQVKWTIINAAREMPIYFCRLFAVNGGRRNPKVQMVGVGHSGVRLLSRFKDTYDDVINILAHIRFEDITEVSVPRPSTAVIRTSSGQHILYTPRATQMCNMIDSYRLEKIGARGGSRRDANLNSSGTTDDDLDLF